jgi:hypothetical protein
MTRRRGGNRVLGGSPTLLGEAKRGEHARDENEDGRCEHSDEPSVERPKARLSRSPDLCDALT